MAKFDEAVLLLIVINVGKMFGQSTISDYNGDEQDTVNVLSGNIKDLCIHNSDALISLARNIQSELQNLKAQFSRHDTDLKNSIKEIKGQTETTSNDTKTKISRLENRIERHDTGINNSLQENKRQMQTWNVDAKAQLSRLENRIERHDSSVSNSLQENRRQMQEKITEIKSGIQWLTQKQSSRLCPSGFSYGVAGYSKCYAVLNDRVNWDTAQQRCRQLNSNAQLAVIINSRDAQITTEILRHHGCSQVNEDHAINEFWIGARRRSTSDCKSSIQWISNSAAAFSMQYSNWVPGEPNCGRDREACASIDKAHDYKWNDLHCAWYACPLCEITIYA